MFFGDPKFAVGENGEGFEKELAGVVVQNSLKVDRFVCKELINNLYNSKKEGKEKGINIKGIFRIRQSVRCHILMQFLCYDQWFHEFFRIRYNF